jgi:hypothetical protein
MEAKHPMRNFVLLGCFVVCGCSKRSPEVAGAVRLLADMPSWSALQPEDVAVPRGDRWKQTEAVLAELSRFDTDVLRAAVESVAVSDDSMSTAGKLFLLNRYLFAIPPRLSADDLPRFGGSWRSPGHPSPSPIGALWPFAVDRTGGLRLAHEFKGFKGNPYRPLEEFDYLSARFGRREVVHTPPAM